MSALYSGALMLIKIGNGGSPSETFTTVGGVNVTRMGLNNALVENSTLASGAWRSLASGMGLRQVSISGSGMFADSTAEEALRSAAFGSQVKNYELYFGNGDKVAGAFLIRSYERSANRDGAENFSVTLESAGAVTFTAG